MTVLMEDGKWVKPERWDACSEPERPVDRGTFFRTGCQACMIKMHAWGRQQAARGKIQRVLQGTDPDGPEYVTIDTALEMEGVVLPRAGRIL